MENRSDGGGAAIVNDVGRPCYGISYKGVWHGDASLDSAWSWITINGNGIEIGGNYFNGVGERTPIVCTVNDTTKGLVLEANFCSSFSTVVAAGSSLLTDSRIGPNSLSAVTTEYTGTLGSGVQASSEMEVPIEGTFTPVLNFGGATTGITYSIQSGKYKKVGKQCFFQVRISLTSKGSATGAAAITGLPFTSTATFISAVDMAYRANMATSVTDDCRIDADSAVIQLGEVGTTTAAIDDTDFNNNSSFALSGWYFTV